MISVALNREKIKRLLQKLTKIKPFIDKYNWEGKIINPKKNTLTITLNVLYAKRENYILRMFQNRTQIVNKQVILLMILMILRMALFYNKSIIIINRNNFKT